MRKVFLFLALLTIFTSTSFPGFAKILFSPTGEKSNTCQSVDKCTLHLTPFGRELWERGMTTPHSSRSMPEGVDKKQILDTMGIPQKEHLFVMVQRRKIAQDNQFVALLMYNTTESGSCESEEKCYIKIGLFEGTPKGALLLASTPKAYYPKHSFPQGGDIQTGSDAMGIYGFSPALHPFINDDSYINVLSESMVGYAGGFATYVSSHIFKIQGKTITPMASGPYFVLGNYAGDWNKDQTRQHNLEEKFYGVYDTEGKV